MPACLPRWETSGNSWIGPPMRSTRGRWTNASVLRADRDAAHVCLAWSGCLTWSGLYRRCSSRPTDTACAATRRLVSCPCRAALLDWDLLHAATACHDRPPAPDELLLCDVRHARAEQRHAGHHRRQFRL